MKKQELQSLVQECIAEVLAEKYSEFQRVDKGEKGVAAKDKGEEETYGAGYAAGERAAKAKYKKLAEAYKKMKEEMASLDEARFKKGTDIGEPGKGFEKIAKSAAERYGSKEAGQKVAGAILKKVLKKENISNTAQMGGVTTSKGTAGYIDNTSKQDKEYADSVRKGMFAVEKPNGQVVKYFVSEKEAQDWISKNDPDGMVDFNIRKV